MESFLKKQSIYQGTSTSFYSDIYDGENAENLSLQLSKGIIDLEKRKLYGETLSAAFPGENPFSEKFIYGYYTKIAAYKNIWLTVDQINLIKNYLSPVFLADIDKLNVAALVEKYGTHMLTHITLGSKLNIIYQGETTTLGRVAIQNTGFDMALQSVFYLWSNRYNQDPDANLLKMIKSPKVAYEVIGGDANKVRVINTTKGTIIDTFGWSESITRKDAVFIKADKMIPLFSLIENAVKKAEVEKYIKTYLSKNEVKLNN